MDNFEFDASLNSFFKSSRGAGSRITEKDEANKRQLTVVAHERKILEHFIPDVPEGSLKSAEENNAKTDFELRMFPSGEKVFLKLNKPKLGKNEMRLYFRHGVFNPAAGDFWFLFERAGQLWIGSLDEDELERARRGQPIDPQNGFDQISEDGYQIALNSTSPEKFVSTTLKYRRDPLIAQAVLVKSGYQCEMMPAHQTFTSRVTGKPYLEAHHLVPMMEQRHFATSLDVEENICILNPYAHRMLHHATYSEIEPFIHKLAERRKPFLNALDVSVNQVLKSYGGP